MAGVNNALAEKHVPYVVPRMDWLAGPEGRKADRVCCGKPMKAPYPLRHACIPTHGS